MVTHDWRQYASCTQIGIDMADRTHYLDKGGSVRTAKRLCERCEVRRECLDFTLTVEDSGARYGIAGGLTPRERDELAKGAAA